MTLATDGDDSSLTKPDMASFHSLFPTSRKGESTVDYGFAEIKDTIKSFVEVSLPSSSECTKRALLTILL